MSLDQIFSTSAIATALVIIISPLNAPAIANNLQQTVNSALYPREPNFFSDGRKQFDREVQLLLQKRDSETEPILKINSEPENIPPELAPLEKPPNSHDLQP